MERKDAERYNQARLNLYKMFFTLPQVILSPKFISFINEVPESMKSDVERMERAVRDNEESIFSNDKDFRLEDHVGSVVVESEGQAPIRSSLIQDGSRRSSGFITRVELATGTALDHLHPSVSPFESKELIDAIRFLDKFLNDAYKDKPEVDLQMVLSSAFQKLLNNPDITTDLLKTNEAELASCYSQGVLSPILDLLGFAFPTDTSVFDNCHNERNNRQHLDHVSSPTYQLKEKLSGGTVAKTPDAVIKGRLNELAVCEYKKPRLFAHGENKTLTEHLSSDSFQSTFRQIMGYHLVTSTLIGIISDFENTFIYKFSRGSKASYTEALSEVTEEKPTGDPNPNSNKNWYIPVKGIISKDRFVVNDATSEMMLNDVNSLESRLSIASLILREYYNDENFYFPHKDFDQLAKKVGFTEIYQSRRYSGASEVLDDVSMVSVGSQDWPNGAKYGITSSSSSKADFDIFQQSSHLLSGFEEEASHFAELYILSADEFQKIVTGINPQDQLVLEILKKEDSKCQIVLKTYRPSHWVETNDETRFEDNHEKLRIMNSIYLNLIIPEITANRVLRDWNKKCMDKNTQNLRVNCPELITYGSLTLKNGSTDKNDEYEAGIFVATKFISDLKKLDSEKDFWAAREMLKNLHEGAGIAHLDIHNGNLKKTQDGEIVIMDYNRAFRLQDAIAEETMRACMIRDGRDLQELCYNNFGCDIELV